MKSTSDLLKSLPTHCRIMPINVQIIMLVSIFSLYFSILVPGCQEAIDPRILSTGIYLYSGSLVPTNSFQVDPGRVSTGTQPWFPGKKEPWFIHQGLCNCYGSETECEYKYPPCSTDLRITVLK